MGDQSGVGRRRRPLLKHLMTYNVFSSPSSYGRMMSTVARKCPRAKDMKNEWKSDKSQSFPAEREKRFPQSKAQKSHQNGVESRVVHQIVGMTFRTIEHDNIASSPCPPQRDLTNLAIRSTRLTSRRYLNIPQSDEIDDLSHQSFLK